METKRKKIKIKIEGWYIYHEIANVIHRIEENCVELWAKW